MDKNNELINEFINASISYGEYQKQGNSRGMDKQSKIISKVVEDIKKHGLNELRALSGYLEHKNIYVRLQVALSIIPIEPNKAKKALNELRNEKSLVAVEAEMILEQLEKGML
ncbi:uncharacterized protein (UPF0371 family) [Clostridium punense]|uniref:Uncharacterized protein (UPF0371 family) n=1 Tax=Clostridium punense TaxID=1054297 RepID=A0ABS4K277_9CLOT|nr:MULTISPECIES: DUF2019 domain-containing protein [Clostridium]EQB89803.1 hypothetical protein M918_18790 [Clostridium sp. BL8]MBP2021893.1 uncharacterized protein (UPF0371 family) [Clostridium punense]